jgi:Tfp pilus assembly protein PilF
MADYKTEHFQEVPVFVDDDTWIWHFVRTSLEEMRLHFLKVPSSLRIRKSWHRLQHAERIIIFWEGEIRSGGSIIEEILDIDPRFDVGGKVIILTANPIREDIVYLSELGVKRVVRIRHKEADLQVASQELKNHMFDTFSKNPIEVNWNRLQNMLDALPEKPHVDQVNALLNIVKKLHVSRKASARYFDALATIASRTGEFDKAEKLWREALDINPNYYRAQNNLIAMLARVGQHRRALEMLYRMQNFNKSKIGRIADIGVMYARLKDTIKAEYYLKRALEKDDCYNRALNELAELRFKAGEMDEARDLLRRCDSAYKFASKLNKEGISLVKDSKYDRALKLYTDAQYVLPQKEKGPQLFFNIGLCYARWGKYDLAKKFLQIALIKQPDYEKAKQLLARLENQEKVAS